MKLRSLATISLIAILGVVLSVAGSTQHQDDPGILLRAAIEKEEVDGDLQAAIELYKQIVADHNDHRAVAAQALLRMGICYEKLGNTEARKAYEDLLNRFADQQEFALKARERLAALQPSPAIAAAIPDPSLVIRRVLEASRDWKGCSISSLGGFFVFSDRQNGYGEVSIHDLSSGTVRRLTHDANITEGAYECVVSPDGKQIAYGWLNNSDGSQELREVGTDGSKPKTLYRDKNGTPIFPTDWSSDGKQILVYFEGIAVYSVDDGAVRVLKKLEPGQNLMGAMRISPDGGYVAYNLRGETGWDIYTLATDGTHDAPLIKRLSSDWLLGWCPDGQNVLFASDRTVRCSAWRIGVREGKPDGTAELVKRDLGYIKPLGFTRDGSFYFLSSGDRIDIYTAKIDVSTGRILESPKNPLQRFIGGNRSPAWSPDGKNLAYISAQSPPWDDLTIRIRSEENGKEMSIKPQLERFDRIQWFPDGLSLMVYGETKEGRGLFRIGIESGATEPLLMQTPESPLSYTRLGPHGNTIYGYCSYQDPERLNSIIAHDLHSGQKKEIWQGEENVGHVVPSPDGRQIVYTSTAANFILPFIG